MCNHWLYAIYHNSYNMRLSKVKLTLAYKKQLGTEQPFPLYKPWKSRQMTQKVLHNASRISLCVSNRLLNILVTACLGHRTVRYQRENKTVTTSAHSFQTILICSIYRTHHTIYHKTVEWLHAKAKQKWNRMLTVIILVYNYSKHWTIAEIN